MIAWMISLAFLIPLAIASFMTFSTSAILTSIFAAMSMIFLHISADKTSSHLKWVAKSTILFLTSAITSLALVIPLATNSRTTLSITAILTFNFLAASRSCLQTSGDKASSHLKWVAKSMILALTSAMISLALVIPFATASRMILSMMPASTFIFLANSLNCLQTSADKASSHLK